VSDGADWTSTGRLFQSRGPAAANERSPTVTSRDGRTSRRRTVGCHSDVTSLLRSLNYQDEKQVTLQNAAFAVLNKAVKHAGPLRQR